MAYSNVGVVNLAAAILGQNRITAFDEATKIARIANEHFANTRDALLRQYVWTFATVRVNIPASGDTPEWGYAYEFPFPEDCLRLLQVGEYYVGADLSDYRGGDTSYYKIESKRILCNDAGPMKIRYVRSVEDPNDFDATFVPALAAKFAATFAIAITDSNTKRMAAMEEFNIAISAAIKANAIENPPVPVADDTWVLSRL